MKVNSYKDLEVWKKSMALVTEVYSVSQTFPSKKMYGLTSQIRRAACSISLNIAEGWGRSSTKSYVQFLRISKGSAMEVENPILISQNLNYLSVEKANNIIQKTEEISKMLNGLIKVLKNKLIMETRNEALSSYLFLIPIS